MITLLHPQDWTWKLKMMMSQSPYPFFQVRTNYNFQVKQQGYIHVCCAIDFASQSSKICESSGYTILPHRKICMWGEIEYIPGIEPLRIKMVATWCQQHWCTQVMENYESNWVSKKSKPQPKQGIPDLPTAGWCHLKTASLHAVS